MKSFLFSIYLFFNFFLLTTSICLANEIEIPSSVKVLTLNQQEQSYSFFDVKNRYDLIKGNNILVLQYKELFEDFDNDDHTTIKSSPFVVTFLNENNEDVILLIPEIADENQAKEFVKAPKVTLTTKSKNNITFKITSLEAFEKNKVIEEIARKVTSIKNEKTVESPNDLTKPLHTQNNEQALNMLNYWWSQASISQKEAFKKIVINERKD